MGQKSQPGGIFGSGSGWNFSPRAVPMARQKNRLAQHLLSPPLSAAWPSTYHPLPSRLGLAPPLSFRPGPTTPFLAWPNTSHPLTLSLLRHPALASRDSRGGDADDNAPPPDSPLPARPRSAPRHGSDAPFPSLGPPPDPPPPFSSSSSDPPPPLFLAATAEAVGAPCRRYAAVFLFLAPGATASSPLLASSPPPSHSLHHRLRVTPSWTQSTSG